MHRALGDVEKERLFLRQRLINKFQAPIREQIRRIPVSAEDRRALWDFFAIKIKIFCAGTVRLDGKIDFAKPRIERAHKTPLPRRTAILLAEMPFASHLCKVTIASQHLGHRDAAGQKFSMKAA